VASTVLLESQSLYAYVGYNYAGDALTLPQAFFPRLLSLDLSDCVDFPHWRVEREANPTFLLKLNTTSLAKICICLLTKSSIKESFPFKGHLPSNSEENGERFISIYDFFHYL
jgi:hypothetical protein